MKIEVKNGTLSEKELKAYEEYALKQHPNCERLVIELDGDYANLSYHLKKIPFERTRRITGYLVGTTDRWNDSKKAELESRVKHTL